MKAAIFDMDGTLLDSMGMWSGLTNNFLTDRGLSLSPDFFRKVEHMSFRGSAFYYAETYPQLKMTGEEIVGKWINMVTEYYANEIQPKPGALRYLEYLKSQNIPMAVATLTDRYHVIPALERHDMLKYFDFILTVEECGHSKKTPDIYRQCARRLGATVADSCVFEDSLYAARTAFNAGFEVIGVYDDVSSISEDEMKKYCNRLIFDYSELL